MLCPACRHDNPAQAIDSRVLTILCALSLAFALPVNAQTTCPSMCGTNGNTELVVRDTDGPPSGVRYHVCPRCC
jgi:hypothetical protein